MRMERFRKWMDRLFWMEDKLTPVTTRSIESTMCCSASGSLAFLLPLPVCW